MVTSATSLNDLQLFRILGKKAASPAWFYFGNRAPIIMVCICTAVFRVYHTEIKRHRVSILNLVRLTFSKDCVFKKGLDAD